MSVRWQDPAPEAPGAGAVPDRLPPGQTALFGRLATAFAERPVWSTLALRNTLGVGREDALRKQQRALLPFGQMHQPRMMHYNGVAAPQAKPHKTHSQKASCVTEA